MKERTVCFTGHRKIPPEKLYNVSMRLRKIIIQLIEEGFIYFGVGGALGFDTLAAKLVLELKKIYPHIKLILVLPCYSQSSKWNEKDKKEYNDIKTQADKIVYISKEYTTDCLFKRNRHLVDNSSLCVCYLTAFTGGTAYTVNYAMLRGLTVINVGGKD